MDYASILRPATMGQNKTTEPEKAVVNLNELDKLEVAGKVTKEIQFPVTCAIKNGVPIFFAQLKGNKRFSVTPVMPKDANGNVLAPPNGEEGFITLELSENAQLTLTTDGKYEFSVRPTFGGWETIAARDARLKAEKAKKTS